MPKQTKVRTRCGKSQDFSHKETPVEPEMVSTTVIEDPGPIPKLKLRHCTAGSDDELGLVLPTPTWLEQVGGDTHEDVGNQEADLSDAGDEPAGQKTRHGRVVRMPKYNNDYVFGSEMDDEVESIAKRTISDDDDTYQYKKKKSTLPCKSYHYLSHLITEEIDQNTAVTVLPYPSAPIIQDDDQDTDSGNSDTDSSHTVVEVHMNPLPEIKTDVYNILNSLRSSNEVVIDLPELTNAADPDNELPYSATFLTQLYIVSYYSQLWNICDLVADTWIRAFHAQRKKHQLNPANPSLWRPNKALEARMTITKTNRYRRPFDANAPNYNLVVADPALDADVTSFKTEQLNTLYNNTAPDCGARLLWADSMALTGQFMDDVMRRSKRNGVDWHEDLKHNIMCTSLRMVRRKLTLKIEEGTEGAWCARYHEHGKHDQPCYRELAWQQQEDGAKDGEESGDGYATDL